MVKHTDRPGATRSDAPLVSAEEIVKEWDKRHGPDRDAWLLGELVVTLGLGLWMLAKAAWWLLGRLARYPQASLVVLMVAAVCGLTYLDNGAFGPAIVCGLVAVALAVWRRIDREQWDRLVGWPVLASWRSWRVYGRRWRSVMTLAGLTDSYAEQDLIPKLLRVEARPGFDRLTVRMIEAQHPDDFTEVAERLAHTFGALACRARRVVDDKGQAVPGVMWLDFHYTDALAGVVPAIPLPTVDAPEGVEADREGA